MATHCMIGIEEESNGKITASYCHYDGDIKGVGATLLQHYNTPELARKVATGGYLSSLLPDYNESRKKAVHNECAEIHHGLTSFIQDMKYADVKYVYIFRKGVWYTGIVDGCFDRRCLNGFSELESK